ncbi:MAG: ABC transporter permease, partial [Chloroflexi bacterium]|nr:ABC transporter permease [Chloroflexota bacterium]
MPETVTASVLVGTPAVATPARVQRRWQPLRRLTSNRMVVLGAVLTLALVVIALTADHVAPYDPLALNARHRLEAPSADFRFGTDRLGRDELSRVVYGARSSLGVAAASVSVALLVGTVLGLVAGYFGGGADLVIGRVMDVFFSFPVLLLAIAIAAMLGPGVRNAALAIAVVYTPLFARVVRAPVISERHRDYVDAARVIGASHPAIITRHILPNVVSPIIVQASSALSAAILIEAALSYIGLGTQPPAPSWGTMLSEGRTFLETAPWMSIFPGLAIALAVLAFNLLGDGLR